MKMIEEIISPDMSEIEYVYENGMWTDTQCLNENTDLFYKIVCIKKYEPDNHKPDSFIVTRSYELEPFICDKKPDNDFCFKSRELAEQTLDQLRSGWIKYAAED